MIIIICAETIQTQKNANPAPTAPSFNCFKTSYPQNLFRRAKLILQLFRPSQSITTLLSTTSTPSASKRILCSSHPPNPNPAASDPSAAITRWHGTQSSLDTLEEPHSYGFTCKAFPTARAAPGRPIIKAISP